MVMCGDPKECRGAQTQNCLGDDPDNGGLIRVKEDLEKTIGMENAEELSRNREKLRDVVVASMELNGRLQDA